MFALHLHYISATNRLNNSYNDAQATLLKGFYVPQMNLFFMTPEHLTAQCISGSRLKQHLVWIRSKNDS